MQNEADAYGGLPGAYRFAYRKSGSRLFKSYVVVGGLVAIFVAVLLVLGLIGVIAGTLGASELVTPVRAFYLLIGIFLVGPIAAPVLLVARRHRRTGSDPGYDARLAIAGYLFIAAVYLGLVISTPPAQQHDSAGPAGLVLAPLYALPAIVGLVPPLFAGGLIWLLHRRYA